jgi:hypothetical protein
VPEGLKLHKGLGYLQHKKCTSTTRLAFKRHLSTAQAPS